MVEQLMIAQCTYTSPDTIAHSLLLFFFQNCPLALICNNFDTEVIVVFYGHPVSTFSGGNKENLCFVWRSLSNIPQGREVLAKEENVKRKTLSNKKENVSFSFLIRL